MITAISSRLMDTDGKLIGIGFNGNSDLGFLATTIFGLTCCRSFCLFSSAANFLRSSSASRLAFSNSAVDIEV